LYASALMCKQSEIVIARNVQWEEIFHEKKDEREKKMGGMRIKARDNPQNQQLFYDNLHSHLYCCSSLIFVCTSSHPYCCQKMLMLFKLFFSLFSAASSSIALNNECKYPSDIHVKKGQSQNVENVLDDRGWPSCFWGEKS